MRATKPPTEVGERVDVVAFLHGGHFRKCDRRAGDQQFPASLAVLRLRPHIWVSTESLLLTLKNHKQCFSWKQSKLRPQGKTHFQSCVQDASACHGKMHSFDKCTKFHITTSASPLVCKWHIMILSGSFLPPSESHNDFKYSFLLPLMIECPEQSSLERLKTNQITKPCPFLFSFQSSSSNLHCG